MFVCTPEAELVESCSFFQSLPKLRANWKKSCLHRVLAGPVTRLPDLASLIACGHSWSWSVRAVYISPLISNVDGGDTEGLSMFRHELLFTACVVEWNLNLVKPCCVLRTMYYPAHTMVGSPAGLIGANSRIIEINYHLATWCVQQQSTCATLRFSLPWLTVDYVKLITNTSGWD